MKRLLLLLLALAAVASAQATYPRQSGTWRETKTTIEAPAGKNVTIGASVLDAAKGILDGGGQVYNVQAYGILPNGVDQSIKFSALLATVYAAGGGTIYFPPAAAASRYDMGTACFTLPNDGASLPSQPPLTLRGGGASPNSAEVSSDIVYGGATIVERCASGAAFLDTRGKGLLEIANLNIINGTNGSAATPFIQTTNTILRVHDNWFVGSNNLSGSVSNQDVMILGGTSQVEDGGVNAPFQGYGTVIEKNNFNRIRRGVYLRTYANGVVIRDNTWWNECGSADSTAAALEYLGTPVPTVGGLVTGNLFEMYAYKIGIKLTNAINITFSGNNFFDASTNTTNYMSFDAASSGNSIYEGLAAVGGGAPSGGAYSDSSSSGNTYIGASIVRFPGLATSNKTNVAYLTPTGVLGYAPVLYVDTVNNRLGIGAGTPAATLDVIGTTYFHGGVLNTDHIAGYTNGTITMDGLVDASAKGIKLPTSCTGLVSGALRNNAGTPAICP